MPEPGSRAERELQRQTTLVRKRDATEAVRNPSVTTNPLIQEIRAVYEEGGLSAIQAVDVFSNERVAIRGVGVPHGDVPTVGYRVDVGDASIGFSSDQLATSRAFGELVEGVDVLVVHLAASENAVGGTSTLHATPSAWGRMASAANVKSVLLSHLSQSEPSDFRYLSHSGSDRESSIASLRDHYAGAVTVAVDLLCVPLS